MAGTCIQQGLVLRGQIFGPITRFMKSTPSGYLVGRSWPDNRVGVWGQVLKLGNVES